MTPNPLIAALLAASAFAAPAIAQEHDGNDHAALLEPYPGTGDIATPLTFIDQYAPVPEDSRGIAIDPDKGYGILDLSEGAYFVTEGVYQVMLIRHDDGLVLVDAPPTIGDKLLAAAEEIAPGAQITHLIYSHAHVDHIGFASQIIAANPDAQIVAHALTKDELERAADPRRPLPAVTFASEDEIYTLAAGGQTLALTYPGPNHQDGNIEIWHEASETLMLVDVVFPGWMMWRRIALAEDIPGTYRTIMDLNDRYDYETLIAGHVGRPGTKEDVDLQIDFMTDLHNAAATALGSVKPGETVDEADLSNPWAVFDNYIDRVVIECVNALTPEWEDKMAGFDVFIYDQCLAMEQSIRVDGPSL